MDKIEEYKKYRVMMLSIFDKIIRFCLDNYSRDIMRAAKNIGVIMAGKEANFVRQKDFKYVMDYFIYDYSINNKKVMDLIINRIDFSEEEKSFLNKIRNSTLSVYKVINVSQSKNLVFLMDILHNVRNKRIIDIKLSQNIKPGKLIFTRIIELDNILMTTEVLSIFDETLEGKLINEINKGKKQLGKRFTEENLLYRLLYLPL